MTIKETIEKWCLDIQTDLKQARPSDSWPSQLESKVEVNEPNYKATITAPNYVYWLDRGRGATSEGKKGRLYGIIKTWVQQKNITAPDISQSSLAYLIARKIDRVGYQGKDFIKNTINDAKIEVLNKDLTVLYVSQIRSNIIKQWQSVQ
jgi:hypothetical protein